MPNSLDIARYLVALADSKGDLLTNKKLQKLLYYVQSWYLVYFSGDLLFSEQPQAWVHGPVYPSVYEEFRSAGYEAVSITSEYKRTELDSDAYLEYLARQIGLGERPRKMIDAVMLKYGRLSAFALETLSHSEKPWLEKRDGLSEIERCTLPLDFGSMKTYYASLLKQPA